MLVAESDRNYVRRKIEIDSQEAEIMKDVPGWEVGKSPYKTRWVCLKIMSSIDL